MNFAQSSSRWASTFVVALALTLRLAAAVTLPLPLQGDAIAYDHYGWTFSEQGRLLDFDGSALTYRPPGYPVFVGVVYLVFGRSPVAVACVQAVLDTALVALILFFARHRYSARAALLAAGLYAISPTAIFVAGSALSETLGTFLALVAVGLTIRAGERAESGSAVLAGLVAGLLTLTRSVMVLFPGVLALSFFALGTIPRSRRVMLAATLCLSYGLALTPWLVRNLGVVGKPVLSTNGGSTLYASWVHPPGQLWGNNVLDDNTSMARTMSPLAGDQYLFKKAIEHIKAAPLDAMALVPQKLLLLLAPWDWEVVGRGRQRSWNPLWPLLALLAAWALRDRAVRWSQPGVVVWLGFASLIATSVMFYGSPRFRVPFEALLIVPAAIALDAMMLRFFPAQKLTQRFNS